MNCDVGAILNQKQTFVTTNGSTFPVLAKGFPHLEPAAYPWGVGRDKLRRYRFLPWIWG